MLRSDSSVISRTGCPPDIVNEEDLTVGESEYPNFRKWNIPKISTKSVYDLNWTEKSIFSEYRARTVEQTFSISKTHGKCCLFSKKNINEFLSKKNLKYLHIGLVQVAVKPLTRKGIDASDGPVYFDCYPDLALALDDPNIIKALTLNILTFGYDMDDGRDPAGKTMLIQCSTFDAKIQVPKMIQWQDITLPREWTLEQVAPPVKPVFDEFDLTKIAQYTDGTVKIFFDDTKCFPTNKPLRINEGRKSFAGSESFVKRNSDVDEFLKKNFEPLDLKLKGVDSNNSQVSNTYYSTKPEFLSKDDQEEEEDAKSEAPSGSDFPPIEPPPSFKHLRVINLMDMDCETPAFQIDMVALSNEFFSKANRDKRKYYQSIFAQSEKDRIKRKWREKMNLLKQHILFFDYLENYYVSRNEVHTNYLNVIKRSAFVKHDKTVVKSNHPPLETVLITCKNDKESTEVKASPFKIAEDKTPVFAIIEQNFFTNESLHIIGQQLDRIEEKLLKNLLQRKNIDFKTSQSKTFELVNSQGSTVEKIEKMLADLKVKTEQTSTSRSVACAISRNEKEIVSDNDTNSDSLSSDSLKNVFDDGLSLPEIKRFFEERSSQTQFSIFADKLYEWNIDGLSEQEIINKMAHMSMVGITYINNHDNLDHPDIVDLLASGFTGSLRGWWDSHLIEESRESIKHAVKRDIDGMPIFYENINRGVPDSVNTLVYTILKHFVGTPSNISSRLSDYLNNLRYIFTSRVMLRKDSTKPYWKERFIDRLPPIFAHKLKDKKKAKYEMGNFYEQYGLPPIAPSRQKVKSKHDKVYKSYSHKNHKRYKTHFVKPNDFYAKNKPAFQKHDKQRSGKGKCFNCGKFGHFSKDCNQKPGKLKNKLNMLNINKNDQNELFQIHESAASTDSFEEDFSSSSDSNYHSRSDVSKSPNIKLGCRDSCCNVIKSVKMLTKSKENDDLLLTMISKIEDPNLQKDYLNKFLKNLTKEDKQQDREESDQQASPSGNVSDRTLINLIDNQLSLVKHMLPKWYTKVKIVVAHDYAFDVVAMIDSGADVNCIKEGLIPSKYFEKSTERLVSANGTKMKIRYELNNAHICYDNVCFKIPSVLVENMTDKEKVRFNTTTTKWNIITSSAEKRDKGKAPAQIFPQDERFPAGHPFVMHEGASSGVKSSNATSL
ncbi:hypothetical protein ACB092_10G084100 [Castanea dentata]